MQTLTNFHVTKLTEKINSCRQITLCRFYFNAYVIICMGSNFLRHPVDKKVKTKESPKLIMLNLKSPPTHLQSD